MSKSNILYTTFLLSIFSLLGGIYNFYVLYNNFILNGEYLIPLVSTIVSLVVFILSFSILNGLFINSVKNIDEKNLYGSILKVEVNKKFPFITTMLTINTTGNVTKKILLKSFLIDLYSKEFKKNQKVYTNKDKTLISTSIINKDQVLNICRIFNSKDFLNVILMKCREI